MTRVMFIHYVADVARSVSFYQRLLEAAPLDQSPNFAMFAVGGTMLGLWARDDVDAGPQGAPGAAELVWTVARDEVDQLHETWSGKGVSILLPPTTKEFGHTFLAADPDGHRLRVLCPSD